MSKHISDTERLIQTMYNHKVIELNEAYKQIKELKKKIETYELQLQEQRESNQILCRQVSYLVCKYSKNE